MKELSSPTTVAQPSREQIAARAYQLFLARGAQPGHETDDWLQAEYELMRLPLRKIIELQPPPAAREKSPRKSLVRLVRAAMF